jgi:hypothetical protein
MRPTLEKDFKPADHDKVIVIAQGLDAEQAIAVLVPIYAIRGR